jgi:hypothetical protein
MSWRRNFGLLLVGATAVVIVVLVLQAARTSGQGSTTYRAPRLAGTRAPNLNGVWQAMTTANWDIQAHAAAPSPFPKLLGVYGATPGGSGIVEGGEIPYQPWALEQRRKNAENRLKVNPRDVNGSGDPETKCYLPGVPRATYMPFPFQIVQSTDTILITYEFADAVRTIHMTKHEPSATDSWMGWSNGRWDGDTLVVDVTGLIEHSWLDRAGDFHSDALHVVERYTPVTPYHLQYEATIEDPKVFTRPWKISLPLYRHIEPNAELSEFKCVPFSEEILYGAFKVEATSSR